MYQYFYYSERNTCKSTLILNYMGDIDCYTYEVIQIEHGLDVLQYTFQIPFQSQNLGGVLVILSRSCVVLNGRLGWG